MPLELSSPAFEDGDPLPVKYTCDGENVNPPLTISGIPTDTESLLIICEDIDDEDDMKTHWMLWAIPPVTLSIGEDEIPDESMEGYNDFQSIGYKGPCPTEDEHNYQFRVYALDIELELDEDVTRTKLEKEIASHILDESVLGCTYQRS